MSDSDQANDPARDLPSVPPIGEYFLGEDGGYYVDNRVIEQLKRVGGCSIEIALPVVVLSRPRRRRAE